MKGAAKTYRRIPVSRPKKSGDHAPELGQVRLALCHVLCARAETSNQNGLKFWAAKKHTVGATLWHKTQTQQSKFENKKHQRSSVGMETLICIQT